MTRKISAPGKQSRSSATFGISQKVAIAVDVVNTSWSRCFGRVRSATTSERCPAAWAYAS